MSKHDFTPEQSEIILDAVAILFDENLSSNVCGLVKHLNDLLSSRITSAIDYTGNTESAEFRLSPIYLDEILTNHDILTDLLFRFQEAKDDPSTLMNPRKTLITSEK